MRTDAIVVPALVQFLVTRLHCVLGPEFDVADDSGRAIVITRQENACRVELPFGRFRLLPPGEAVCHTCRYVLSCVQQFVSAALGYEWPEHSPVGDDRALLGSERAKLTVTEREGLIAINWVNGSDTVLTLSPIVLSELLGVTTSPEAKLTVEG